MISLAEDLQVASDPARRSEAEQVLLTHALAVRLILARMEEAIEHGADEDVQSDLDDIWTPVPSA